MLHLVIPGPEARTRNGDVSYWFWIPAPRQNVHPGMVFFAGKDMTDNLRDRLAIRDLIENWVVWRDAGDWQRFRSVWFDDGRMMATWTQGSADEFIEMSKQGWAKGVSILHFLGAQSIDIAGQRAISQTKMTISQRAPVHDIVVDVVCTGRFYDFLEKRDGRWGLVLRQPIYEKDRMDPLDPAARLTLDAKLLASFPEGYRHLAYLQSQIGYKIKPDMPGLKGDAVAQLYASGAKWLKGEKLDR
ncbi:MAG: hypothetical protein QOD09_2465 [Bradyrhizobium sp.]|nr:hypothetical protein [Bradyrhizobium sp.]